MSNEPNQIRREIEKTQDDLGNNVDELTDRLDPRRAVQHRKERARGAWQRMTENVMGSTSQARDASGAKLSEASSAARQRLHGAGERVHGMGEASRQQTQGHPLAAGLVAFGLGVLASSLFPASTAERRVGGQLKARASEHSGELKQQAADAARQARDNLREPTQQAANQVRSSAGQRAGQLREQTQATGQDVREQAQQAAHDVRQR